MSIVSYTLISVDNFLVFILFFFSSRYIHINDYETDNSISSHSFRSTGFSRVKALGRCSDAAMFFFFFFKLPVVITVFSPISSGSSSLSAPTDIDFSLINDDCNL